jgi:signal transduction histidine kinase
MSAALLQVRMLQGAEGDDLRRGLDELRVIVATSLEEIYELIENLGSHDGANADLGSRLQSCVGSFRARCDIDVTLEVDGDHGPVSESLEIALFRIVQEALSNVRCHSGAEHVAVGVHFTPDEVVCEITDDGAGFSLKEVGTTRRRREPFGLRGMQERARLLDGECAIDSVPGQGTRVRAKIPVWRA